MPTVGIILLFMITSVTPMVIGYASNDANDERDMFLENLAFMCYDERGSNAKYEYYKEHLLNDDVEIVEPLDNIIMDRLPQEITSGPMNSPWPMYGHDRRHTGRSPYNSTNNIGVEKWNFKCDSVESSAVIDNNGIIYFGCMDWYVYALSPDGTLYWKFETGGLNWESPAIAEDGTIYVTSWSNYLHALNPDGTEKWRYDLDTDPGTSPVIAQDGTIYIGTMFPMTEIIAVNPDGTEKMEI